MHPRTEATLAELRQADWFRNVGVLDTRAVDVLTSWHDAIQSCSSPAWSDLRLEAANQYRERLLEKSVERFSKWNELVSGIRPAAEDLVREKTQQMVTANNLPRLFVDKVSWDIVHLCMEAEYADVFPPGFYGGLAYWYVKGHFPCGYKGDFPKGRLVVY
jgi:hypothetical protein